MGDRMATLKARSCDSTCGTITPARASAAGRSNRFGPNVATDVSSVTCNVCRTEIGRVTSYIDELVDGLGGRVFHGILEDAGVFDRLAGL